MKLLCRPVFQVVTYCYGSKPFHPSVYAVIKHQATLSWRSTLTRGGLAVLEHLGRKASWCGAWVDVFQGNMLQPRKPTFSTQLSMVFTNIYQYIYIIMILYYIINCNHMFAMHIIYIYIIYVYITYIYNMYIKYIYIL
jgi:hypothetical protein